MGNNAGMRTLKVRKGRGATNNLPGRFANTIAEFYDDGWYREQQVESVATEVRPERARSIINTNKSPDVPFDYSINPYRGCEHGCIYCYARPAHAYVDLSPGIDFETRLFFKQDAAGLLRRALLSGRYQGHRIALGGNTDVYQPIETQLEITRSLLDVMAEFGQPFSIVTKGSLVLRDLELLSLLARRGLVHVYLSVTTLDDGLKRIMEPRAAAPAARLRTIEALRMAEVPVGMMVAPIIPFINDSEIEAILQAGRNAGAQTARYILLRLPNEVQQLFKDWLQAHFPERAAHVMKTIRDTRGGRDNDPRFSSRMRGEGVIADLIKRRFTIAAKRLGLDGEMIQIIPKFEAPAASAEQLPLF